MNLILSGAPHFWSQQNLINICIIQNFYFIFLTVNYPIDQLLNVTHRQQWIQEQVSQVYKYFYDGINFDTEGALPLTRKDLRDALTSLVNETCQILKAKNENYQVSFRISFLSNIFRHTFFFFFYLQEIKFYLNVEKFLRN